MKKKKIRRCIFALWCILAIIFLIAVNIYNGNEKAENVISDLVRIYIGASFIIIGIIYKLRKINNGNFQKGRPENSFVKNSDCLITFGALQHIPLVHINKYISYRFPIPYRTHRRIFLALIMEYF